MIATLDHIPGATGRGLSQELLASPPSLLLDVLARARAAGGTVDGYLIAHGLSRDDLDRLRGALTHGGGPGERHDRDDGAAPRPG